LLIAQLLFAVYQSDTPPGIHANEINEKALVHKIRVTLGI